MYKKLKILALILCLGVLGCGEEQEEKKGLELFFVRHAETIANVTGDYREENTKIFSVEGLDQIVELRKVLHDYEFDHIIVSPLWRAQKTILPYLSSNNIKAEIWPEFSECCWQTDKAAKASDSIQFGKEIEVADSFYFCFRDYKSSHEYLNTNNYNDGIAQVTKGFEMLMDKFSNTDKKILIVGHYFSGGNLLKIFLGKDFDEDLELKNAKLSHIVQKEDGTFKIDFLNR